MPKDTSKKSWNEFKDSDAQSRCQKIVLKSTGEPLTGREICAQAAQDGLWKRLSEMDKTGLIETCWKRRCTVTGKTAYMWRKREDLVEVSIDII